MGRLWVRDPALRGSDRVLRMLQLAGYTPLPMPPGFTGTQKRAPPWAGWPAQLPGPGDLIATTGAEEDLALSKACGAGLLRIQAALLRGLAPAGMPGREDVPLGLLLDDTGGWHGDADRPSALEQLLASHPLDETPLLDQAREAMARIAALRLARVNMHPFDSPAAPRPGYVLVLDQPQGDPLLTASRAGSGTMREMLFRVQDAHPGARIVIAPAPETLAGAGPGHFTPSDIAPHIELLTQAIAPQQLFEGAVAVHTVSSLKGFEAILAGHRPVVHGRPFYAGWGLTEDLGDPLPRRGRKLTRAQLFAGAMILAPVWVDPCRDRRCRLDEALNQLEAEVIAWRQDHNGHIASGMHLWKRSHLQRFFGQDKPLRFVDPPAKAMAEARAKGRSLLVWGDEAPEHALRVEDGLIRSRGLGANLVPPVSLAVDDLGLHYDPSAPSRLEQLIAVPLRPGQRLRAERLIAQLRATRVTKYNLGGAAPEVPAGHRILVPGQVEDDASIRLGAGAERTNLALLQRVRAENPDAVILWKPHPDVEARLRPGAVADVSGLADVTLRGVDAAAALDLADEVWTMTSGLGFEALLRGVPVTCLGAPFYAGWGLTRDLGPVPARRRQARPDLETLVHAALIAWPRYLDPATGRPCPVECVVERLASDQPPRQPLPLRLLSRAQSALAGQSWLWRRS